MNAAIVEREHDTDVSRVSDIDLVRRAEAGDVGAFELLHSKYRGLILHVAIGVARDHAAAEDAVQIAFLWLLQARWRPDSAVVTANGGIHGFVKAIAIYAAWRTHRPVEGDDDDLAVALRFTRSTWPTPEARLLARELRQRVRQAIRDLPPQYRRTALLRYVHELSGPAIAERLGVASVTVPGYLHQVRARLRPALADLVTIAPPEGRARGGHLRFG